MFSRLKKAKLDGAVATVPGVGADKVNKTPTKKSSASPRKAGTSGAKAGGVKGGKKGKAAAAANGEAPTKAGDVDDGEAAASSGEDHTQATTQAEGGERVVKEEGSGRGYDFTESEKVNGFTSINHATESGDEET